MRSIIYSTGQLSDLRRALLEVVEVGDADHVVEGFVASVHEVVAAGVTDEGEGPVALDVRWHRRTEPHVELYAEVRNAHGTPAVLVGHGIPSRVLHHLAERVDIDERIGGSVVTVRCRV